MQSITNKITHKESICQLYRSLLRKATKIRSIPPSPTLLKQKDPQAYINQISNELRVGIIEQFRINPKRSHILANHLVSGITLNDQLDQLLTNNEFWDEFLNIIEHRRNDIFNAQMRRGSYLSRKDEVADKEAHLVRGRDKRRISQRIRARINRANRADTSVKFDSQKDRNNFLKKELITSQEYSRDTLRRYLSHLQEKQIIPIPSLLPYTRESLDTDKQSYLHIIDGVSRRAISEAYDKQYLQSIIIPSMEYDINHVHNFNKIETNLNEKGPYIVKGSLCHAGTISVPLLKSPFKRKVGRKKVAEYVKKSVLLHRTEKVWESKDKNDISGEISLGDGSYFIPGLLGFRKNAVMYPRSYYENLAYGEATFELFMKMHELEARNDEQPINLDEFSDWFEFLDITSEWAAQGYQDLRKEIEYTTRNGFESTRGVLQKKMNKLYRFSVARFSKLNDNLTRYSVHKHSEIVSPPVTTTFKHRLNKRKEELLLPTQERIGRGKTLGDFLEEHKLRHYHYGYKFLDRFKF
ncbi:hypothetical protein JA1_000039 [Spathaspora sp. JA1]|nr:hypothetical protein JA1_000039 [Spathaspora sp. JA1]